MVEPLIRAGVDKRRIDIAAPYHFLAYSGMGTVSPVPLVHDVLNCGWRLALSGERIFYATDTATLEGISAPNYSLYLVEANYKVAELEARLRAKEAAGEYAYESRVVRTHLSEEQAVEWLAENMGPNSQYVFLHRHEERN